MVVFVVTYDSGMYGSGVSGIFSTRDKADKYIADRTRGVQGYTTFDIEEVLLDEKL